jgi:hypothetical protein
MSGQEDGRLGVADRATPEPSPQAVSSLRGGIAGAGHTPLPWGPDTTINLRGPAISIGWLCSADPDSPSDLEARANAAFIVRACNNFPQMLAALEAAQLALLNAEANASNGAAIAKVEAAIAKATGAA